MMDAWTVGTAFLSVPSPPVAVDGQNIIGTSGVMPGELSNVSGTARETPLAFRDLGVRARYWFRLHAKHCFLRSRAESFLDGLAADQPSIDSILIWV
jgi:hypothetical protein